MGISRHEISERVLRTSADVEMVLSFTGEDGKISAVILPRNGQLHSPLTSDHESNLIRKWRKTYDLSQMIFESMTAPLGFNIVGWNSSYTRNPISEIEIREWIETTVSDICHLNPRRVYEIGCGTGLLLLRIAPTCEQYLGADFSEVVLTRLKDQLARMPDIGERVRLTNRVADDFSGIDDRSFDTVILSSVVQYFPSIGFLTRVLEGAIRTIRPGGNIYVGDIRSLPLLPVFATSVEYFHAEQRAQLNELRDRISRRIDREQELVISPSYFSDFKDTHPEITALDLRPIRGRSDNEMTRFRYQAILQVGGAPTSQIDARFEPYPRNVNWIDQIRQQLIRRPLEPLFVSNIINRRIERHIRQREFVNGSDSNMSVATVKEMMSHDDDHSSVHPDDLLALKTEFPSHQIYLSWAASRSDGSFDLSILPSQAPDRRTTVVWPRPELNESVLLANSPGKGRAAADLSARIMEFCRERLPAHSVPNRLFIAEDGGATNIHHSFSRILQESIKCDHN